MFDSNGKFIPIRLPDVPKDVDYNFPNKLNSVNIKFVSATTINDDGSTDTDTAYYIDYDLQSPPTGPYAAKIIRFLTDDPQAIRDQYPIVQLRPKRETIGIATAIDGNANAQQIDLPTSIHGPIDITVNEEDIDISGLQYAVTPDLPISDDFFQLMVGGDFVAGYEVSKTILNLYEVSVVLINIDGLYSNKFVTTTTGQTRVRHVLSNFEPDYEVRYKIFNDPIITTYTLFYVQKQTSMVFTSTYGSSTIIVPERLYYLGTKKYSNLTCPIRPQDRTEILSAEQWQTRTDSTGNCTITIPSQIQQEAQTLALNNHNSKYKIRSAASAATTLQKDKNLAPYFIFDSDGTSFHATSIKSPAPTFGMTSPTAGSSVAVTISI
jgi:hypothetical protein